LIDTGERKTARIVEDMQKTLQQVPALRVEYVEITDAESLEPVDRVQGRVLVAIAGRLGSTRLIDNILVDIPAP